MLLEGRGCSSSALRYSCFIECNIKRVDLSLLCLDFLAVGACIFFVAFVVLFATLRSWLFGVVWRFFLVRYLNVRAHCSF